MINPKLSLNKRNPDYSGSTLTYWPSYSRLAPSAKAAYLEWLAGGKNDPNTPIGYVFLYYYGLERRLLHDLEGGSKENSQYEVELIKKEIRRLIDIYGTNSSFRRYASQLLDLFKLFDDGQKDLIKALDNESLDFNDYSCDGSYSRRHDLNFKRGLAYFALEAKPLPPDWALKWVLKSTSLNTPAERCKNKFQDLFRIRYYEKFGEGIKLDNYKETLIFTYRPASSSFSGTNISIDTNLPEFTIDNKYIGKFQKIIDECTDKLDPYSRYLGRNPDDDESVEAISNLPKEIIGDYLSTDIQDFANQIKEELDGMQYAFVSTENFTNHWDIKGVNRYQKKESIEIAQFFFKLGFGVEPDLRFGSAKFERNSQVVFFKIDSNSYPQAPSKEYKLAIREKMFEIYTSDIQPPYLNKQGEELLKEGRKYFDAFNLLETSFLTFGNDSLMFVWKGSVIQNTLMLLLKNAGLNVSIENTAILARDCTKDNFKSTLENILKSDKLDPIKLVDNVKNKEREKFDQFLPDKLLNLEYYKRFISVEETYKYIESLDKI